MPPEPAWTTPNIDVVGATSQVIFVNSKASKRLLGLIRLYRTTTKDKERGEA